MGETINDEVYRRLFESFDEKLSQIFFGKKYDRDDSKEKRRITILYRKLEEVNLTFSIRTAPSNFNTLKYDIEMTERIKASVEKELADEERMKEVRKQAAPILKYTSAGIKKLLGEI